MKTNKNISTIGHTVVKLQSTKDKKKNLKENIEKDYLSKTTVRLTAVLSSGTEEGK